MASSSRKKRARKRGNGKELKDRKGKKRTRKGCNQRKRTRGNEKNRTPTGSKKKRPKALDDKELAKQRRNEHSRKRYAEDSDYREKLLAYQREYQRTHLRAHSPPTPEQQAKYNANERERYATDPDYRAARRAAKRKARRKNELKHKYGLSLEDYQAMLARQGGACAICKGEFTHTPFVDHCHITGQVRRLILPRLQYGPRAFQRRSVQGAGRPPVSAGVPR